MPVRTLAPTDAAAYVALRREMLSDAPWAFASSPGDDQGLDPAWIASRFAEPGQAIVGAFDGGRLVGAAGLYRDRHIKMAHRARIWGVYVSPAARGRGVGTEIMTAAIEIARAWPGVDSIGLSVSVRSVAAAALYQRLGFEAWGVEPDCLRIDGSECDEVHMVLFFDRTARRA